MDVKNSDNQNFSSQSLEGVLNVGNETGYNNILFPDGVSAAATNMPTLKLVNLDGSPTAVLPLAGQIAYDSVSGSLWLHRGSGVWVEISGSAASTLENVLTAGNTTGANDISVNSGQSVSFAGDVNIPSTLATSNVKLGYNAGAAITTGTRNVLVGPDASSTLTTGANNTTLGYNARTNAVTTTNGTALGYNSLTGNSGTASGRSSSATGDNSCSYGYLSSASGLRSSSFGYNSSAVNPDSSAFGANASCSGQNGLALGKSVSVTGANAVGIGYAITNSVADTVLMAPASSVRIDSTLRVQDSIIRSLPISLDIDDADFTLTTAQVLENFVSISALTANRDCFFPTFTDLNSAIPNKANNDSFIFYIENSDPTFNVVLKPNTGCSFQPTGASTKTIGPGFIVTCLIQIFSAEYHIRFIASS